MPKGDVIRMVGVVWTARLKKKVTVGGVVSNPLPKEVGQYCLHI